MWWQKKGMFKDTEISFIKLKKKRLLEYLFQPMEKISQNNKLKKKAII